MTSYLYPPGGKNEPAPAPIPAPAPTATASPPPPPRPPEKRGAVVVMPWIVSVVPWVFCLILGARLWYLSLNGPSPAPTNFDSRFVPIGQSYVPELCGAYASSLDEGAKLLDAGQPVSMAIDTQSKSWESGRLAAFDKILKPEFSKIIPEGTDDKTVTSSDRLALANAWRGTAKGLREGSKP